MWPSQPRPEASACVVSLSGDLDLLVADELRLTLQQATDEHRNLVLDLAEVRFVDSMGLGVLVRAAQAARNNGGVTCVAAPSAFFLTVLQTMRLERVFQGFRSVDEALAWLDDRDRVSEHR